MRTGFIAIFLFLNFMLLNAQDTMKFSLTLRFEIPDENKGQMLFALYDSAENHMKNSLKSATAKVENGIAEIKIEGLEEGYYSFSYFYDENSNNKLDTNFLGIPRESYGFSNGEKGRFGPPDFEECKILIDKNQTLIIKI